MISELEKLGTAEERTSSKSLSDAGHSILKSLDQAGCSSRSSAVDLLAADALFTYAFEAASDSPQEIHEASRDILDRVTSR